MSDDDPIMNNPEVVAEIATRAFARAKAEAIAENDRLGIPSYGSEGGKIVSDHARLDARSLALHRLIAQKVLANPALLDVARGNLRRSQKRESSPSQTLAEWEQILSGTVEQIAAFLAEQSERATRLRQSTPFAGVLTEDERLKIFAAYSIAGVSPAHLANGHTPNAPSEPKP